MIWAKLRFIFSRKREQQEKRRFLVKFWLIPLLIALISFPLWQISPAFAKIDDDRYDGNIYVLFAGNGSLVPPRLNIAESFQRQIPAILVFYIDDSSDCKKFSGVVSRLQEYYEKAASIIPINVDSIPFKSSYKTTEPGYYYKGLVPQTVVLDRQGEIVFDKSGQIPYEEVDDVLREVFDLLPREESVELKRRSFNEFNSELVD